MKNEKQSCHGCKSNMMYINLADTVFSDDEGMTKNSIRITYLLHAMFMWMERRKEKSEKRRTYTAHINHHAQP